MATFSASLLRLLPDFRKPLRTRHGDIRFFGKLFPSGRAAARRAAGRLVNGNSLGIGHCVIHWSLVIGHSSLVIGHSSPMGYLLWP